MRISSKKWESWREKKLSSGENVSGEKKGCGASKIRYWR
jgi:hypothetical protein